MAPAPSAIEADHSHYAALGGLKDDQWQIKYLYDRLGVVDNKTSALLRLNGVIMGFVTVAVFRVIELQEKIVPFPGLFLLFSSIIFLLLFYAEYASFRIFYLRFDRIYDQNDFEKYKETFFRITVQRESIFRRLRITSFLGTFLFSLMFLLVASWHAFAILAPTVSQRAAIAVGEFIGAYAPFLQAWLR